MQLNVEYILDNNGNQTAVLIPIKDWEKLNVCYSKSQQKISILNSLKDGLKEVANAKKTNKKLQTLESFLDEC